MIPDSERGNLRSELGFLIPILRRMLICGLYFIVSYLLLSINSYGLSHTARISFVVAILAGVSSRAWLASFAIALLTLMTLIPVDVLKTIANVFAAHQ